MRAELRAYLIRAGIVVLAIAGALAGTPSYAQQVGPPEFPQTLPANTVVGRTQAGVGPASAIPFSTLGPLLTLSNPIVIGSTPISGGINGNCLVVSGSVIAQGVCGNGAGIIGGITVGVRSSSAATVTASATTDYFFCLDPTSNTITLNLPSSPATGLTYLVKDCTGQAVAHNITITPAAGNIDGSGTYVITSAYQSVAITYTGSQWSLN